MQPNDLCHRKSQRQSNSVRDQDLRAAHTSNTSFAKIYAPRRDQRKAAAATVARSCGSICGSAATDRAESREVIKCERQLTPSSHVAAILYPERWRTCSSPRDQYIRDAPAAQRQLRRHGNVIPARVEGRFSRPLARLSRTGRPHRAVPSLLRLAKRKRAVDDRTQSTGKQFQHRTEVVRDFPSTSRASSRVSRRAETTRSSLPHWFPRRRRYVRQA